MKNRYAVSLLAAALVLVARGATVCAAQVASAVEAGAQQTDVIKRSRNADAVTVQAKDGVITLPGTVSEDSKTVLAGEAVEALPEGMRGESKLGSTAGPVRAVPLTAPSRLRVVGVVTRTSAAPNDTEKAPATKGGAATGMACNP